MAVSELTLTITPRMKLIYMFIPLWMVQMKLGKKMWVPNWLFKVGSVCPSKKS